MNFVQICDSYQQTAHIRFNALSNHRRMVDYFQNHLILQQKLKLPQMQHVATVKLRSFAEWLIFIRRGKNIKKYTFFCNFKN